MSRVSKGKHGGSFILTAMNVPPKSGEPDFGGTQEDALARRMVWRVFMVW